MDDSVSGWFVWVNDLYVIISECPLASDPSIVLVAVPAILSISCQSTLDCWDFLTALHFAVLKCILYKCFEVEIFGKCCWGSRHLWWISSPNFVTKVLDEHDACCCYNLYSIKGYVFIVFLKFWSCWQTAKNTIKDDSISVHVKSRKVF